MPNPYEFTSSGAALTAAMSLIGTSRRKFIVQQVVNHLGQLRWVVTHPDGSPAIPYEALIA